MTMETSIFYRIFYYFYQPASVGIFISGNPRIYSLQSRAPSAGRYLRRLSKMAGANAADRTSGIKSKGFFRGFHSHGGTPTAGWFISWKILIKMDDN